MPLFDKYHDHSLDKSEAGQCSSRIQALLMQSLQGPVHLSIHRALHFTRAMKESEGQPLPLRWALGMLRVMEHIPVLILPHELIVGRAGGPGRYGIFYPELDGGFFGRGGAKPFDGMVHSPCSEEDLEVIRSEIAPYWQGKTYHDGLVRRLPEHIMRLLYTDADGDEPSFIVSETATVRHSLQWALDYEKIITRGFASIAEEAAARCNKLGPDQKEEQIFYQTVILLCEGIRAFAWRYAAEAERQAALCLDMERRGELAAIAERCRRVPWHPARTFAEAVQAQWFAQLVSRLEQTHGGHISNGRVDQYLYPLFLRDKEQGSLGDDQAVELLQCLWANMAQCIRITPSPVGGKLYQDHLHWEFTTIGGQTRQGQDAANELSLLVMESALYFPLDFPYLGIRLHQHTPEAFLRKLCRTLLAAPKLPVFLNDDEIIPLLTARGAQLEEARDYCGSGFSEARMLNHDTYFTGTTWINLPAVLEMALYGGACSASGAMRVGLPDRTAEHFQSMAELWQAFERQLLHVLECVARQQYEADVIRSAHVAGPYLSTLHDLCMEAGRDISTGGFCRGRSGGNIGAVGFATVVDSLAAIEQLVYEENIISLPQLLLVLKENFEGHEPLRQRCLHARKLGQGHGSTESIGRKLEQIMVAFCQQSQCYHGGNPQLFYVPVAGHLAMGRVNGATPDGRLAGEALSYGISPSASAESPPSLALAAVQRTKAAQYHARGSRILRLELARHYLGGPLGEETLMALLRSWCAQKHWFLQLAIVEEAFSSRKALLRAPGLNTNFLYSPSPGV